MPGLQLEIPREKAKMDLRRYYMSGLPDHFLKEELQRIRAIEAQVATEKYDARKSQVRLRAIEECPSLKARCARAFKNVLRSWQDLQAGVHIFAASVTNSSISTSMSVSCE